MRALIVTVAGMSTRFSRSLGRQCLKCIYYPAQIEESLLWRMLRQPVAFDWYVIVGGYRFDELKGTVYQEFQDMSDRIMLVENGHYKDYGSGYSLYLGLREALKLGADEVVFAEGDLYVDTDTFREVAGSQCSVVTSCPEPILASRAVAFYFDRAGKIHYLYDTGHNALNIREPFTAIYNSGQIWKFADKGVLERVFEMLPEQGWQGTNLVMVEEYFRQIPIEDYEIILFKKWVNCNTIEDFRKIQ